jgi:hypothetical protein
LLYTVSCFDAVLVVTQMKLMFGGDKLYNAIVLIICLDNHKKYSQRGRQCEKKKMKMRKADRH